MTGKTAAAMEQVDEITLSVWSQSNRPAPFALVVSIAQQLAAALEQAHRIGIVLGDLDPDHLLLRRDGEDVVLTDPGIHRKGPARPEYLAPEQIRERDIDRRTDLFSCGVILYELLSGVKPFSKGKDVPLLEQILEAEPEPIDQYRPDLPLRLRRTVERCLRKDPNMRFQSAGELGSELKEVARGMHTPLAGMSVQSQGLPLANPHAPALAGLLAGGLIALLMAGGCAVVQQSEQAALQSQATRFGVSLANFIASQSAESALTEDWGAIEAFVQDTANRNDFDQLQMVDRNGIVRGSTVTMQIGAHYTAPPGDPVNSSDPLVRVAVQHRSDGSQRFDFAAPVVYHGKPLGQVHLGIAESKVTEIGRLNLKLLAGLSAVISLAAGLLVFFLTRRHARPR